MGSKIMLNIKKNKNDISISNQLFLLEFIQSIGTFRIRSIHKIKKYLYGYFFFYFRCIELDLIRSTFKKNVYDFYKPNLDSSYPTVNGLLSQKTFLESLDYCYNNYHKQIKLKYNVNFEADEYFDYWVFHSPYNKLVQKSFARVIYNDFQRNPNKYIHNELLKEYKNY